LEYRFEIFGTQIITISGTQIEITDKDLSNKFYKIESHIENIVSEKGQSLSLRTIDVT